MKAYPNNFITFKKPVMKLTAPLMDQLISQCKSSLPNIYPVVKDLLTGIYQAMCCIKPEGDDEVRNLWIDIPRGSIRDFGDFEEYREEGLVGTYEEFEQEWKDFYPDPVKWYSFTVATYQDQEYFYINSGLCFTIDKKNAPYHSEEFRDRELKKILELISTRIREILSTIKNDVHGYNTYLDKTLPYQQRTGRIIRKKYWDICFKDAERLNEKLGRYHIEIVKTIVERQKKIKKTLVHSDISADDFFRYCEICYDANNYFDESTEIFSPGEKYKRMSDGRNGGLIEINPKSGDDFRKWYKSGRSLGAHPWEICRGGNSTHISLMVSQVEGGWNLILAGSSRVRVEETVRMAVALYDNYIPFILHEGEEILQMITGNDYIGIVPDHFTPRYCHSLFPAEDRIIDFMNLGHEYRDEIISNAYWYPLDPVLII